MQEKRPAL